MKFRIVIGILCILIVSIFGLLVVFLFENGYLRFNYPSYSEYPVRGIDVSNHQHEIDWSKLDKTKVQFAFIKATEGGDFKDKRFVENWRNARNHNIQTGAYHFFTFCKSGEEQAANFIETVPDEEYMLPPVLDLEYGGNCKLIKTTEQVLSDVSTFVELLEEKYKRKVIFYVTKTSYQDFLVGRFPNNPIWFRDVYFEPRLREKRAWLFWQFADRGRLNGIDTFVDLNVFKGNKEEFLLLLSKRID